MEILVIVVAVAVITALVLRGPRQAKARTQAAASRTPSLMPLAERLGGKLAGPGEASAWSRALQARSTSRACPSSSTVDRGTSG